MSKFKIPEPDLQITFYYRLQEIRETHLLDALLATVKELDITEVDRELSTLAARSALSKMAGWGLRAELVFAVPCVLKANPRLLGYYRLLLGFSQKQFYGSRYGFGSFKSMETDNRITAANEEKLVEVARTLCASAQSLVESIEHLSKDTVHELTLLTLGPQLRGGALNLIGSKATRKVFDLISSLLEEEAVAEGERSLEVKNAAGRLVRIEFAADPDICIREELPSGNFRNLVAIEIKGGKDYSNIHNRIGEAEKSHRKARKEKYVECWTMVGVENLDMDLARRESPTTDRFYQIENILDASSGEAGDFRENLLSRLGIRA